MTKEELIAFEDDIIECFKNKMIRAPIHLDNGNEDQLISVFGEINPEDWVFCSWRSHEKCLLKGVPKEEVKRSILKGKSISLCFPEYNVFSSAIVGGSIPIALGTALAIKRKGGKNRVYVFMGEMTAETGIMWECFKYANQHALPIRFIIEDNNKSVCTDTRKTWNAKILSFDGANTEAIYHFKYESKYPHAGVGGARITF